MTLNIFMDNVDTQIKSRVDSFVAELTALVKKAAVEAVTSAIRGEGSAPSVAKAATGKKRGPAPAAAPAKAAKSTAKATKAAPASSAASKRKAGQKRSPDEIAKTTEKLLTYIAKNNGQRIEEIAKGVGNSTKELTLPIKKLLTEKKISSKGEKRATRYFVAGK